MPLEISSSLEEDISRVIDGTGSNIFEITCIFKSSTDSEWSWKVRDLFEFDMLQNYFENYTDVITMSFFCMPFEYLNLTKFSQDLWCEVSVVRTTHFTETKEDPVLEFTYRAIIKDKRNLDRNYPIEMIREKSLDEVKDTDYSNRIQVDVDLIDPVAYDARKRKINFVLKDAKIIDAILTVVSSFGIEDAYIVEPDNTAVYENLYVPPSLSISDVFNYLQTNDALGIYDYGARVYITDGTLYLYPIYDTEPAQAPTSHIYVVAGHMYQGLQRYDSDIEGIKHILSNSGLDDASLIEEGVENSGNWFMCQQPQYLIDRWRVMDEESFSISTDHMESIIMNPSRAMTTDAYSPINVITDNLHHVRSIMAGAHLSVTALRWNFALPMYFKPGQLIVLHHDTVDGYKKAKSLPTAIAYIMRQVQGIQKNLFSCTCNLNLISQLESE